jgi:elongator complex protein 2
LIGHDAGVTAVAWNPNSSYPVLLSTSVDSSAILWSPTTVLGAQNQSTQLWTNHQRFGDVGGQRLGGFVGGRWINHDQVFTWGWNGGFRRWGKTENWEEMQAITGHAGPVQSVDWEPEGGYLVSAR